MKTSFLGACQSDGEVGLALGQIEQARHRHQFNRELGLSLAHAAEAGRQEARAKSIGCSDPDRTRDLRTRTGDVAQDFQRKGLDGLSGLQEALALRSQHIAAHAAIEQSGLQRALELLDAPAQGGVINAEPLGRNRQTTSSRNGEEGLHRVPVERGGHTRFLATKPPIYQNLRA